jgi:hypothetical protein
MGASASVPMYIIEDIPGKGRGLIATQDIPKSTMIISETPTMTVCGRMANMEQLENSIRQQLGTLAKDQIHEFLAMSNVYPFTNASERWRGIFHTNALPIGSKLDAGGVFFQACRINHACDPNAQNFWNENLHQLTIHAVRDICKGEEITIYYLSSHRNRQARQKELQRNFKLACICQLCSLPQNQSRKSDSKLDRIHEIDCLIEQGGVPGLVASPRQMLTLIHEKVQLWNDPVPNEIGLTRAYPDAFEIAIANGDLARARTFAEILVSLYTTTTGADSPDVTKYKKLSQDPTTHRYYAMSMEWKTGLNEVPQGFGSKEFDDWLWRR